MARPSSYNQMSPAQIMRSIQTLTGECHALYLFCQSIAKGHPDPAAMLPALEQAAQHGLAYLESHPVADALIDGYQETLKGLRKSIEVEMATRR